LRLGLIERLGVAAHQHHRHAGGSGVALEGLAECVAIHFREADVDYHDLRLELARAGEAVLAGLHRGDLEVFVGKRNLHDLLHGRAVFDE
jgi:hypothetical protein